MEYEVLIVGLTPFVVLNAALLLACLRMARETAETPLAYETGQSASMPAAVVEPTSRPTAAPQNVETKAAPRAPETPSAPKHSAEVVDLMEAMKQNRAKVEVEALPKRGRRGRGKTR